MGPIRVLHVDDRPEFGALAAEYLEREDDRFEVITAGSPGEGLARLESARVDCVVSDYEMPDVDGLEFLDRVREAHPEVPFILFTGKGSEEIASEAIARGVTDYLQKGGGTEQYQILSNRIANAVERHRSREALKEREASLARSQQIANMGNWDWDLDSDRLYWSDQIYRIFGVDPETFEATYDAFLDFVHPEDRSDVRNAVDAALSGRSPYDVAHRIVRSDGEVRVVRERAEVTRDDGGDPVAMSGTVRDVTDRVARQRELERYEAIVETTDDGVYVFDERARFEFVNRRVVEVTGIAREAWAGEHVSFLADRGVLSGREVSAIEAGVEALVRGDRTEVRLDLRPDVPTSVGTLDLRLTRSRSDDGPDCVIGFSRATAPSDGPDGGANDAG
ncbi:MAG: PAS domain-containing protein [Salinigranum sp.]